VLADHASGLGRTLVEEEVAARLERAKPRTGDLPREDARVLKWDDHVIGAVHDQCGDGHRRQSLE